MINQDVFTRLAGAFHEYFGREHTVAAYAPGRIEVMGNHTDYNDGFVLSAAIDLGTFFVAARCEGHECRLVAADIMEETRFDAASSQPSRDHPWSNYVRGVLAGLRRHGDVASGFVGMFLGNIPLGAGLSSSAALEMTSGLGLCALYDIRVGPLELAKIGQTAEHDYAGVRCGLLDQLSSLYGKQHEFVLSDFRSLDVDNVRLGAESCFLMCNTGVKHSLVDSEYNERRGKCEEAAAFFADVLDHPVTHLRDVNWDEWKTHQAQMDRVAAKRSAHVIGENARVLQGRPLLEGGALQEFGKLMYESHESSRVRFENSCRELDFIVNAAKPIPGVLGARLSGGGFGGSAVVLAAPAHADAVAAAIADAYGEQFEHPCEVRTITPSDGAGVL